MGQGHLNRGSGARPPVMLAANATGPPDSSGAILQDFCQCFSYSLVSPRRLRSLKALRGVTYLVLTGV